MGKFCSSIFFSLEMQFYIVSMCVHKIVAYFYPQADWTDNMQFLFLVKLHWL